MRAGRADDATARWFAQVPKLQSDSDLLCRIGDQTTRDLLALRVETRIEGHVVDPARSRLAVVPHRLRPRHA